jgi:cytochrome P450
LGDCRFDTMHFHRPSSPEFGEGPAARVFPNLLDMKDPPERTRLRKLVSGVFTPQAVESLRPRIAQVIDELLETAADAGSMDLMADFASQVSVVAICELLGVPVADRPLIERWAPDFSRIFEASGLEPDERARCHTSTHSLCDYFELLVRRRRFDLGDDLLSALIQAEVEGDRLTHDEAVAMAIQLLSAGCETSMGLIGNGTLALLRHRDQFRKLRMDRELAVGAVEECLRYDSPVQFVGRVAREDVELHGVKIAKDQRVWMLIGSANRDPDFCDYPDQFDITRYGVPHLSFGFGPNFCPGAHLARLEAHLALRALVSRFPALELASDVLQYRPSLRFRTLESLPVVFKA